MDAKEQSDEIWCKIAEFVKTANAAPGPGGKEWKLALIRGARDYAKTLISSALSAQAAEVERLKSDLAFSYSYFAPTTCGPVFGEVYRRLEPYAAPPAAPEPTP